MGTFFNFFRRPPKLPDDETEEILSRHLSRDFKVFPMAEERTPLEAVQSLGQRLGINIPLDVQAHLTGRFPGIYIEAREEVWPRPKEFEVGPFWSFLYGLHTYTASHDSEDWMRMDFAAGQLKGETGLKALPVLRVVGDADVYCLNETGKLVRFDHELGELKPVEMDFFDLFEREIEELAKRTLRKKNTPLNQ